MGAGNVKLVFTVWWDLPNATLRLLAYMAVVSKDADAPYPLYWGGREDLAKYGMGRPLDGDPGQRRVVYRKLARLLASLSAAGAVSVHTPPAPGRNAVYELDLSMERVSTGTTRSTGRVSMERVVPSDHNGWSPVTTTGVTGDHPKEEEDSSRNMKYPRDARTGRERSPVQEPDFPPEVEPPADPPTPLRAVPGGRTSDAPSPRHPSLFPALVADPPRPDPNRPGYGTCVPCFDAGKHTVAADPVNGSACGYHQRTKAG